MVKGIVNAFDHMGFCLVLNLITTCTDGKWAVIWPPGMLVLLPTFTLGSKYLLPAEKVTVQPPYNSHPWDSKKSGCCREVTAMERSNIQ